MDANKSIESAGLAERTLARFDLLERRCCLQFNRLSHWHLVRWLFAVISRLGDGIFWYLLMLYLPLQHGSAGLLTSLQMAITGLVGLALYKSLKSRLVRERPFAAHPAIVCGTPPLDRYSFPSGHTLHAVLFTTLVLAAFPGLALILVPFALLIALSRVILGLHYPTDVVVGAAIGYALARTALWLVS